MTNKLTQADLKQLALQSGFTERNPGSFGQYAVTDDELTKFAQLIQQRQGEAIGHVTNNDYEIPECCTVHLAVGATVSVGEKVYTTPPTASQLAAQALEKAARYVDGMVSDEDGRVILTKSTISVGIRALIDQPVDHIVDANKMVEQGGDELVDKFVTVEEAGQPEHGLYLAIYRNDGNFPIELIEYGSYSFYNKGENTLPDEDDDGMVTRIGWSVTVPDSMHDSYCYERDVIAYLPVDLSINANRMVKLRQSLANRRGGE